MMMFPAAMIVLAQAMTAPALPQPMAMDTPVSFGGVQAVCTGVGSAKDDLQWSSYPIRIEFSNGGAQYLSGAHVTLSSGGAAVADLNCAGPWVLVKGNSGAYRVTASINGSQAKPVTAPFTLRPGKQQRIVLRFPDFQANE
ncbi:MAG TPA: hypothetical protein VJ476_06840 [Rhizomicrobium sp.]|nr:hypothetical protein [Rhizomicrobium sp.]